MKLAKIKEIQIPEKRHRKTFEESKIQELAESISDYGLLHPPVLRELPNGGLELVAGERRLRAIQTLSEPYRCGPETIQPDEVPYLLLTDLEELRAREIELEENIRRLDLSWKERVQAISELHALRTAQDPSHTLADTAREITPEGSEINVTQGVKRRLILAEHLDDPEIQKAKTEKEALKVLKRKLEGQLRTAYHDLVPKEKSSKFAVQEIDAVEGLRKLPAASVDIILTDPPYGIHAGQIDARLANPHPYSDAPAKVRDLLARIIPLLSRVSKPKAHAYLFCDIRHFGFLSKLFKENDWFPWPVPLIWVKDQGHIPMPNHGPRRNYECILFANRGMKPTRELRGDVLVYPTVKNKEMPAQKPVELFEDLLQRSALLDELVLDPFCGTGTIFAAAYRQGLRAIGFDNDPSMVGLSKMRIENLEKEED